MSLKTFIATLLGCAALAMATQAQAGPGHDHGHDHGGAPAPSGPALPRFAASSDLFELVGVLKGRQITLYLDRAADNAPISGAQIELEIAGAKFNAEAKDDTYLVTLAEEPKPGVLPVTATVMAGSDIDLLAGELDLHEDAHADEAAHVHSWTEYAGWAAVAVAALVVIARLLARRLAGARQRRAGAAA